MLKKMLFSAFLAGFALTANAQIATPQLDAGFHTYGGAATGWRYNSTINLLGISAEGKTEYDGEEGGDVKSGLPAGGPDDTNSVPFLLAAYRGETFGAELYTNLTSGLNSDIEIDLNIANAFDTMKIYKDKKEKRLNLAYVIGETLSIGLGYSSINLKSKTQLDGANFYNAAAAAFGVYTSESISDVTTTNVGISASLRIADVFFVAAGVESVTETGTYENEWSFSVSGVTAASGSSDADYVDNSWTSTMYGLGVILGEPDDTQFRAEYSVMSSPESEEEADGDKLASEHNATTTTFMTVEVKWNNILIAYQNETDVENELNDSDSKTVTTLVGLGWQPMEGFTLSLYSFNREITMTTGSITGLDKEIKIKPSGYRLFLGYNF